MICGAGRVAEQGGRTLRLLICGAGRVAEKGGKVSVLLVVHEGWLRGMRGDENYWFLVPDRWLKRVSGGHQGYWFEVFWGAGRVAEKSSKTSSRRRMRCSTHGRRGKILFLDKNQKNTIIVTMLGAIPCSHLTCPGLLWKISELMPYEMYV